MVELGALALSSFQRAPWGWGLLAAVLVALIKAWPVLALQAQQAREKRRAEHRDDLHDCQERLDILTQRVDGMQESYNNLKIELSATLSAYRILDTEIEATNPRSLGLAQARAILSTAFTVAPSTIPSAQVREP
jgi:uncharacterized protein YlxW (UPF0749 family)